MRWLILLPALLCAIRKVLIPLGSAAVVQVCLQDYFLTCYFKSLGYSRKFQTGVWGGRRVEDMDFQGYWQKSVRKFQWSVKIEVEFSRDIQKRIMWNFHGSWVLTWNFQEVSHNFADFKEWKLVFSGISKRKVTNLKIADVSRKVYTLRFPLASLHLIGLFWNSPILHETSHEFFN